MKDDSLSDVDRKKIAAYHKSIIDSATVKGGVFSDSLSDVYDENFAKDGAKLSADYKCSDALEELSRYNYWKAVDSVGKQENCFSPNEETNVYAKQIWNDAIEAAALLCGKRGLIGMKEMSVAIRKLKK